MKRLQRELQELKKQIRDLESYMGVLLPVFEKEYKKGGWDFSKR